MIHCKFFRNRLYNYNGTNKPDPSLDTQFLNMLRFICNNSSASLADSLPSTLLAPFGCSKLLSKASSPDCNMGSQSSTSEKPRRSTQLSSLEEPGINMAYEGPGIDFGRLYYRTLLQGRGNLVSDQQLMSGEETAKWVNAYASDVSLFRRDFARAMVKLSNLQVLTGSDGQVRVNCSKMA
ncbi:putative Peroxidase 48 [Manihot esculenta]|uniref:putative Peroxidase 48 n=1 Tax=Manihot esculenta TaxID=3983 RepID=UPI000B5D25D8|nr:putative Peroxidase 48 [Manihot esculenta]